MAPECMSMHWHTSEQSVTEIHAQMGPVMQVWRLLMMTIWLGQAHGIDAELVHHQLNNMLVHCPLCPEPHVNMDESWQNLLSSLRHLNQLQLTADGNHHANRYKKNSDPLSYSLFHGRAYFPEETSYQVYLKEVGSGMTAEKTTCNHINAAEKQDWKKFRNMDVTGIVNIGCSHTFIKSSVDLQLGERFVNTDMALHHALVQHRLLHVPAGRRSEPHAISEDFLFSYDIACSYGQNLVKRFMSNFKDPSLSSFISRARMLIPAVHVQNHQDNCMYLHLAAYTEGAGHFHGENCENPWIEMNQNGAQLRQMNPGAHQDLIIDTHGDWNWKKMKQIHLTLEKEVNEARDLYRQHKQQFQSLCNLHHDKISCWNLKDRIARTKVGKIVECVYCQSTHNVPSQKAILASLLESETRLPRRATSTIDGAPIEVSKFINEGLDIQGLQHDIKIKTAALKSHFTITLEKEIEQDRRKLKSRLDDWHVLHESLSLGLTQSFIDQDSQKVNIVDEKLFLPSDINAEFRKACPLLADMGSTEASLREGIAFDIIINIQQYVKASDELLHHQRTNCKGQDQNTRAKANIECVNSKQLSLIDLYNNNRRAMVSLDHLDSARSFPPLTFADTVRLPPSVKRALGQSRKFDGAGWTKPFASTSMSHQPSSTDMSNPTVDDVSQKRPHETFVTLVSTQGGQKKFKRSSVKLKISKVATCDSSPTPHRPATDKTLSLEDRWIWRLGKVGNLTEDDICAWEEEAEAEMERWREQWEMKVWSNLSTSQSNEAAAVYARKKAALFCQMASQMKTTFISIQKEDKEPTLYQAGESVVTYILRHRMFEMKDFHPTYIPHLMKVMQDVQDVMTAGQLAERL
ncbi:hypothetical protein BJ165DRAFT_1532135 [Panaeolus papilionaceus]|nr:hypothetical protein BJ165DRAFT_1532135 [Panaeolus papilionaceus]